MKKILIAIMLTTMAASAQAHSDEQCQAQASTIGDWYKCWNHPH